MWFGEGRWGVAERGVVGRGVVEWGGREWWREEGTDVKHRGGVPSLFCSVEETRKIPDTLQWSRLFFDSLNWAAQRELPRTDVPANFHGRLWNVRPWKFGKTGGAMFYFQN